MTDEQKTKISELRAEGCGYGTIAQRLGMSPNTVKSFCRRNKAELERQIPAGVPERHSYPCKNCGKPVQQTPHRKRKMFCSDHCRNTWWNSHLEQVQRKAIYEFTCPCCGKQFTVYGNKNRKYCSHECYIEHRFGGVR